MPVAYFHSQFSRVLPGNATPQRDALRRRTVAQSLQNSHLGERLSVVTFHILVHKKEL
jgi:hypothetical protein